MSGSKETSAKQTEKLRAEEQQKLQVNNPLM